MIIKTGNRVEFMVCEKGFEMIKNRKTCYDKSIGYVLVKNELGRWTLLHRFLLNAPKGAIVDHKNRVKTDNRLCNLRFVTKSENNINRDGVVGVYFDSKGNRWRASISINGTAIKLGSFKTKEEATEIRRRAELKYFPNVFLTQKNDAKK